MTENLVGYVVVGSLLFSVIFGLMIVFFNSTDETIEVRLNTIRRYISRTIYRKKEGK